MISISSTSNNQHNHQADIQSADAHESVHIPDMGALPHAQYIREGADLLIQFMGESIRIDDYFLSALPPVLLGVDNLPIDAEWIAAHVIEQAPSVQVADLANSATGKTVIGITTLVVDGPAKANNQGVERILKIGDPIYLYDTLLTGSRTYLKVTLKDGTVFQLGPASRATLDAYEYQSATKISAASGDFEASIFSGVFRFISGAIGDDHQGQHSRLNTPSATIGIRGSEIDGQVLQDGSTIILHTEGLIDIHPRFNSNVLTVFEPGTLIEIPASRIDVPSAFSAPTESIIEFRNTLSPLNLGFRASPSTTAIEPSSASRFIDNVVEIQSEERPESLAEKGEAAAEESEQRVEDKQPEGEIEESAEVAEAKAIEVSIDPVFQTSLESSTPEAPRLIPQVDALAENNAQHVGIETNQEVDDFLSNAPVSAALNNDDNALLQSDAQNTNDVISSLEESDLSAINSPSIDDLPSSVDVDLLDSDSPTFNNDDALESPFSTGDALDEIANIDDSDIVDVDLPTVEDVESVADDLLLENAQESPEIDVIDEGDLEILPETGEQSGIEDEMGSEENPPAFIIDDTPINDEENTPSSIIDDAPINDEENPPAFIIDDTPVKDVDTVPDVFSQILTIDINNTQVTNVSSLPALNAAQDSGNTVFTVESFAISGIDGEINFSAGTAVDKEGNVFTISRDEAGRFLGLSIQPDADFQGEAGVSYLLSNTEGGSILGRIVFNVTNGNAEPDVSALELANDQFILEGEALVLDVADLLANDIDTNAEVLQIVGFEQAVNGTISPVFDANDVLIQGVFTPDDNFKFGSFTYSVRNESGEQAQAQVVIMSKEGIAASPIAALDTIIVDSDAVIKIPVSQLLANDSDPQGEIISFLGIDAVKEGIARVENEILEFIPSDTFQQMGGGSLNYQISNEQGLESIGQVLFVFQSSNQAPLARADIISVNETAQGIEIPLIPISQLLANDSDLDGDVLSIESLSNVQGGTALINNANDIIFVADDTFDANSGFVYVVTDGQGNQDTARVSFDTVGILPNQAPIAQDDNFSFMAIANQAFSLSANDLLANDTDAENDLLNILEVSLPENGQVSILSSTNFINEIVFIPSDNFISTGQGRFNYTIGDGKGNQATATVFLDNGSVVLPNQAPIANNDQFTTSANTPLIISSQSLLSNDTDFENDVLSITTLTALDFGEVKQRASGDIEFIPTAGVTNQTAHFIYSISDGKGGESNAEVAINIDRIQGDFFNYPSATVPLTYQLNAPPISVAPRASVSDIAFMPDTAERFLRISLNNATDDSQLFISNQAGLDLSGDALSFQGLNFATVVSQSNSDILVSITPKAGLEGISALLQAISYQENVSALPATISNKSVSFGLYMDLNGAIAGDTSSLLSASAARLIEVLPSQLLEDDALNVSFNTNFIIAADTLLSNDNKADLEITEVLNASLGVDAKLEADGIHVFIDATQVNATSVAFEYRAASAQVTSTQTQQETARVTLTADNVLLGDEKNNTLKAPSDNNTILRGEGGNDILTGGLGDDLLIGGIGNDLLNGGAGYNQLLGGGGDDSFALLPQSTGMIIKGGSGVDTLNFQGDKMGLNLMSNQSAPVTQAINISQIEVINLFNKGNANNQLTLGVQDVLNITEAGQLFVEGDKTSSVTSNNQGWVKTGNISIGTAQYIEYSVSGAQLLINVEIDNQFIS